MQRMQLAIGTRAEVLAELDQLGRDATQSQRPDKATLFARAFNQVEEGDNFVVVRQTRYEITD